MKSAEVHGARILLVDDRGANAALLEESLIAAGYTHFQKTSDTHKVIDLQRNGNCDLILLDMDFLGEDGFTLLKNLRENTLHLYQNTIALTENPDFALRSLRSGAKDVIDKIAHVDELLARIHNVLESYINYKLLEKDHEDLKHLFIERTTELQESETRFIGFTNLAADWYWEQDSRGNFTKVSGPVPEILGIEVDSSAAFTNSWLGTGWDPSEQTILRQKIAHREPFLDFEFTRHTAEHGKQTFLVSGQPMFDTTCNFLGYRGVGAQISVVKNH
jgi:CheY-like chemotaxis protein